MSENSRKTARVQSLRKKLQERRAASGGPKGDFYIVGDAVKDAYSGLFVMERYQGKYVVVSLGPKSNDTKNPYQEVIRDEIIRPRKKKTYAPKNMSDVEIVSLVVSQEGIPADQVELVPLKEFQEDCEIVKEASKEGTPEEAVEETPSVVDVSEESAEEPPSLNSQLAAFKTEVAEAMSEQLKEIVESVNEVVGALEGRMTGLEQKMPDVAAGADPLSLNLADDFSAAADTRDARDSGQFSEVEPVAMSVVIGVDKNKKGVDREWEKLKAGFAMAGLGLQAEFDRVKNVFRRKARFTGEFTGTLFVEWDNHDDKRAFDAAAPKMKRGVPGSEIILDRRARGLKVREYEP